MYKNTKLLVILNLLLLAVSACVNYAGMQTQATSIASNKLQINTQNSSDQAQHWPGSNWWTQYADPQLNQLIQTALADNPTLKIAAARERLAQQVANETNAGLYPVTSLTGDVQKQHYSEHGLLEGSPLAGTTAYNADLNLNLQYQIDWWGKNRAAVAAATDDVQAATAETASARLLTATLVAQYYFQWQIANEQIRVVQELLQQQTTQLKLVKLRNKQGIDSEYEVQQLEGQLASTQLSLAQIQRQQQLSQHQLAAMLGLGPDNPIATVQPIHYVDSLFAIPSDIPANLLGRRPDITAQRWRTEAAAQRIQVAKAEFYPNVNLAAMVGLQTIGLGSLFKRSSSTALIGPAIDLPLFDAGARRANLGIKNAEYDIAVEQYNQTIIDAFHQVGDALSNLGASSMQRKAQAARMVAVQQQNQLTVVRYHNGLDDQLSVLQTSNSVLMEHLNSLQIQQNCLLAQLSLIQALGGGY